ncbi:unnamed protein product [Amoebophrya sp. A25]|nr:unnamed protein product [Amoebophrya sp. A25]|eukprot:GSA25T00025859001.1
MTQYGTYHGELPHINRTDKYCGGIHATTRELESQRLQMQSPQNSTITSYQGASTLNTTDLLPYALDTARSRIAFESVFLKHRAKSGCTAGAI